MKLDETIVARVLSDFAALIKGAAESTEKGRFTAIIALARQAQKFQELNGARVSDFDDGLIDPDGGIVLNANPQYIGQVRGGGFGDQAEMIRTIIDSFKDINLKRTSPAAELNELLSVRRSLKKDGETTEDIDTRIKTLRKEIADGHAKPVVHPQLLRGSETGTLGSGNDAVVGERDADGAEGSPEPLRTRGVEGLGEGDRARPQEGIPHPVQLSCRRSRSSSSRR